MVSKGHYPPVDRSSEIFSILQRKLPPEIICEILNLAQLYYRETYARRLQSVRSSCGLSKASREEKRKVYLQVPIKTVRKVRKLIWSIRMPDVRHNGRMSFADKRTLITREFSPLEVSLYRPTQRSPPDTGQTYSEIKRSLLSFPAPQSAQTNYRATWTSSHDLVELIRRGDKIKLILPAVFGDDRSSTYGRSGGEIWEADLSLFTEW